MMSIFLLPFYSLLLLQAFYSITTVEALGTLSITLFPNAATSVIGTSVQIAALLSVVNFPPLSNKILPTLTNSNFIFQLSSSTLSCDTLTINGTIVICEIGTLPLGVNSIVGVYKGDVNYPSTTSSSPSVQTVNQGAVILFITPPSITTIFGNAVTFTATLIKQTPSSFDPSLNTSNMIFKDLNNNTVCQNPVIAGFQATCTTTMLTGGTSQVFARFDGDNHFGSATSQSTSLVTVTVETQIAYVAIAITTISPLALTFTARLHNLIYGKGGQVNFIDTSSSAHRALCYDRGLFVLADGNIEAYCKTPLFQSLNTPKTVTVRFTGNDIYLPSNLTVTWPQSAAGFAQWADGASGLLSGINLTVAGIKNPKAGLTKDLTLPAFSKQPGVKHSPVIQLASTDVWELSINNIFTFIRLYCSGWNAGKYDFDQPFTICSSNNQATVDPVTNILTVKSGSLFSGVLCFSRPVTQVKVTPQGVGTGTQFLTVASAVTA